MSIHMKRANLSQRITGSFSSAFSVPSPFWDWCGCAHRVDDLSLRERLTISVACSAFLQLRCLPIWVGGG